MNNYEHLLSQDPIGAFDKIKANYVRYFENAYKITDNKLNKERIDLLTQDDNLYKSPYLELLPEYNSYEGINDISELADSFAQAFGSIDISRQFFEEFIKKGLMDYIPYAHQVDMLKKVFCNEEGRYNNTVITTGTGSGKTEAFLLPLLAQLFKEAKTWQKVSNDPNWFDRRNTVYSPCQRENDTNEKGRHYPALRALIMYPMNALVEDQMARLRKALDSDVIREFLDSDEGLKGNRIYFGSYNGSTIGMKNYDLIEAHDHNKLLKARRALKRELTKIHDQYTEVVNYFDKYVEEEKRAKDAYDAAVSGGNAEDISKSQKAYLDAKEARKAKEDVLYTSPRLDGNTVTAEMVTRWDMQNWPPDILITNVSMLSIMLMRKAEKNIFDQTRKWLKAEDLPEDQREEAKKNRIFHIVLDELHLYRDTAGSETACLIRMLLKAIDLPPVIDDGNGMKKPNPQLRVLASSASLGSEDATQKFMEEFFGVYNTSSDNRSFNIVPNDKEYKSDYEPESDTDAVKYEEFSKFTNEFVTLEEDAKIEMMNELAQKHKCKDAVDFVHKYERTIFADFLSIGCKHGVNIDDLVYQNDTKRYIFKTKEALRGFLIFRAYADRLVENGKPLKHRLPRFRFHQFFKYIEGLWGELKSTINNPSDSPAQSLSYKPDEIGPHNGKVLELLRCECCGELFIGGNRKVQEEHTFLTLNYPMLDIIPNYNPTPMVQNKSFEDYALFWPSHIQEPEVNLPQDYDHMSMLNSNETAYIQTGVQAKWRHCYLDVFTGEVLHSKPEGSANLIEGFLLEVDNYNNMQPDLSIIHALPCCCPHCHQNYTNRKYAKSPIRSFRTGIDRSNQLLSKELIYQLNDKTAKLIGFSDSRQDAAKQALGIETEHYRDMVRLLFFQSVEEVDRSIQEMIDFIKSNRNNYPKRNEMVRLVKDRFSNESISEIVNAIYDEDEEELRKYVSDTISLNSLIGQGNKMDGILLKKLVKLGINPAGAEHKYQQYIVAGSDERLHWSRAFDYDPESGNRYGMYQNIQFDNAVNDAGLNYNSVANGLSSAVFANSFGKYMGVSTLDAGLGYICCRNTQDIIESQEYRDLKRLLDSANVNTLDFVDAFIRVLGDNYRYKDPDFITKPNSWTQYSDFISTVKKPIEHFMDVNHFTDQQKDDLKAYLYAFLRKYVSDNETILNFNQLSFRKLNSDTRCYVCPKCGRVHPNKGFGFCTNTNCLYELSDDKMIKVTDLQRQHYISFDILNEPRAPRRLHTEELTGQTDNIQERLLNFKDMVLLSGIDAMYRDGFEATKPIDMINVTTTMEVGVDIGSLEAIFQGNMPPTRYNYQQRVGRGGRRGQAFCTAVTFCRGRSHDVYYYKKATDEIVGGMPAAPELSLSPYAETDGQGNNTYHMKLAIMKRVIVKELLNKAFANLPYDYELTDNCGEFGRVSEWPILTRQILIDWIDENNTEIDNTVDYYFSQFNKPNVDISNDIRSVKEWIKTNLVAAIDNSIIKEIDLNKGLAQCLSELGYLPMYGMPSDVRSFYHGSDYKNGQKQVKSIDRSSELSISEFAPGNEKTKDKGVYRVEALTLPMDYRQNGQYENLSFFFKDTDPNEEKDALKDRYIITYDQDLDFQNRNGNIVDIKHVVSLNDGALIQSRNLGMNQRLIVIPRAFRSYKIENNNGTPTENNDRSSSFTQCQIWAQDDITNGNIKETVPNVPNVKLSVYGLSLSNNAQIWHVNSNNNRFFRGKYSFCEGAPYTDQLRTPNFTFFSNANNRMSPIMNNSRDSFEIALGSKKPTEMIRLELKTCPDVLNLNIHQFPDCNRAAVRAAFFSAAFLLQRSLADLLDVQPEEIEISEKISEGQPYPVIYLSDALPNGAGIVSYLAKEGKLEKVIKDIVEFRTGFMKSLIGNEHRNKCRTACQDCLLSYSNRGYHHILDWRLGVGILRLMMDPSYDFGFTEETRNQYPELFDFDELIVAAAKKANTDLKNGEWIKQINNPSREPGADDIIIYKIFYHPLWDKAQTREKASIQNGHRAELYDTFNLLRSNIVCITYSANTDEKNDIEMQDDANASPSNPMPTTSRRRRSGGEQVSNGDASNQTTSEDDSGIITL